MYSSGNVGLAARSVELEEIIMTMKMKLGSIGR